MPRGAKTVNLGWVGVGDCVETPTRDELSVEDKADFVIRVVRLPGVVLYAGNHALHKSPPFFRNIEWLKLTTNPLIMKIHLNLYLLQITTFGKTASLMGPVDETRLVVTSDVEN